MITKVGDEVWIHRLPFSWEPVPATVMDRWSVKCRTPMPSWIRSALTKKEMIYLLEVHDPDPRVGGIRRAGQVFSSKKYAGMYALRRHRSLLEGQLHDLQDKIWKLSRRITHLECDGKYIVDGKSVQKEFEE